MATGLIEGQVTFLNRSQVPAPSSAAASCSSCGVFCSPASSATVVCGMPAQTPTTITAGRARVKPPSQSMLLSMIPRSRRMALRRPASGW